MGHPGKDPAALRRELVGWYIYDFANSAFFQSAMTVFVPLLVDDLANEFAWSRHSTSRPSYCSELDSGANQTNCVQCVEGDGDQLKVVDPITGSTTYSDLPLLSLPGGINPTSFIFTMISISVLFQAIAFITVGSLGDYGNFRKRGLVLASTVGASACCLFFLLPISASMYWVGGLLIMISNVSLGVSVVFYNSYLPLMVEDCAEVVDAIEQEKQGLLPQDAVHKAREAANSEISSKGQMWGYVGGTSCLIISVIAVFITTTLGMSTWWSFGVASSISGFWWQFFSMQAFKRLPERPGPEAPKNINLLLQGWIRTYKLIKHLSLVSPNTNYFLLLFFIFSDGYATIATVSVLFASRELCMGALELSALAVIVPFFAALGGYAWHALQKKTKWSSQTVLVINLMFLAVLPLWGCIGFFSTDIGLRNPQELYVLAAWFGACLGSAQAFGRALFSELIPKGHEADMFALFEITDKGSSWLGPLIASVVVQTTGKIRPVLLYLLAAMVLPGAMLHFLDLTESIKNAKREKVVEFDEVDGDETELTELK